MKKTIKLTENDLSNLIQRVISEQGTSGQTQNSPQICSSSVLKKYKEHIQNQNNYSFKIQTGASFGMPNATKYLFITDPTGKVCGCKKSDFFMI